jgi:hypothetical protein
LDFLPKAQFPLAPARHFAQGQPARNFKTVLLRIFLNKLFGNQQSTIEAQRPYFFRLFS